MNDMMTYNENIAMILEGNTPRGPDAPGLRHGAGQQGARHAFGRGFPLAAGADGGQRPYSLTANAGSSRKQIRESIELVKPVEGSSPNASNISQNHFGVKIAAAATDRIAAWTAAR